MRCYEDLMHEILDREQYWELRDEYWHDIQDAAAHGGVDVVTLLEETPFDDWLRKRREAYGDRPGQ